MQHLKNGIKEHKRWQRSLKYYFKQEKVFPNVLWAKMNYAKPLKCVTELTIFNRRADAVIICNDVHYIVEFKSVCKYKHPLEVVKIYKSQLRDTMKEYVKFHPEISVKLIILIYYVNKCDYQAMRVLL